MAAPLQVRRVLTDTPLARQHEMLLAEKGPRRPRAIPWQAFRRARYPEPALALAHDAQRSLALGEYTAVDLFAHLASALALNGVPFDLVAAATRIPADEIRHADYALRMAGMLAGKDASFAIDRVSAGKRWTKEIDLGELDLLMVEVSAMGETLACALLAACAARATDPTLHAIYANIVADEVHHARLGWYYLAWRAPRWTRAEQQRVANRAGELIVDVETRFWRGRDAPKGSQKAARALGVLESKGQRETILRVMQDEIVPGLDALGLGASHAWRMRRRGK